MAENLVGKGRKAIAVIVDENSFAENVIDDTPINSEIGPGAVVGTALLNGKKISIISNDAQKGNPRFPVVYAGVIGMEEAYKMTDCVYKTIAADSNSVEKRPLLLLVDTPGNGPGKIEEIFGMNKATGSYQLALAQARQHGHPVIAVIIGRAISGAFLCHGLQADRILALSADFGTMIHVMPLSGIARITKLDIERLESLSKTNPVFASGADFFYKLGGLEEIITAIPHIRDITIKHINEVYALNAENKSHVNGPMGRGEIGAERGGRKIRKQVINEMTDQFNVMKQAYL